MKKIYALMLVFSTLLLMACNEKAVDSEGETAETEFDQAKQDEIDFQKANGKLTPEIMWKFGRVSDIQVSPDGKSILYGITKYSLHHNKGNRDLYLISTEGGDPKQLTDFEGSEWNAAWRPDGKKIGFISAKDGDPQVYEINPDGTELRQVTEVEGGLTGFHYAPDMKNILFTADVKLDQKPTEKHADLPKANVRIIDELMYRHWNEWHDYAYSHIFVAPYQESKIGEAKDIMDGERYDCPMKPWGGMEQINWSPDGKKIAYCCKKMSANEYAESTNSEIYIYDLESGETINLTADGYEGYDHDPVFSPDATKIAWKSMATPGFEADKERMIVYDFETKEATDFTKGFDQNASHYVWSGDGKTIYFISGIKATYQLYQVDLESADIRQITSGVHNYQSMALAGGDLIATKMSMSMPTEIFRVDPENGEETQLSFTNQWIFDKITMGKVEERWIKTTDGKDMLTWVIYPPNFDPDKKYPALLYCQGGPQSAVSQFFSYRWNFQIMAANDYIIVAPNRRGLPTFGQEWNDQISGDYGGQNMKDYLSAIDEMAKEDFIDEENLGAVGASYGGYSVFWLAGHHEGRFGAFISHCGIYNFESMYGSTEEYFFVNHDYEGPYWADPKPKSYEFSPHLAVKNWDTPILIVAGEHDYRIPYTQSLEAFNSAQLLGVESRLLFFPDETHFVLKPQNAVLWQREFFGWLDQYLK